ncbi:Rap1a/Tai family immunity protein [Escherichia coli]|uniref:Rap1a/Tai family immunity protein n=1 Tax=Escherichia coli TaxID=562 RepID=UPI0011E8D2BE|nr:Rap1a/Tai family immunity protein [Escherichia coli]
MKKTLCALILGVTSFSAFSYDGNTLYDWGKSWKNDSGSFNAGVYSGYVLGVNTAWRGRAYCAPSETINEQMFDIVLDYLKAHPATRNRQADQLVIASLAEAYPCQKQ